MMMMMMGRQKVKYLQTMRWPESGHHWHFGKVDPRNSGRGPPEQWTAIHKTTGRKSVGCPANLRV